VNVVIFDIITVAVLGFVGVRLVSSARVAISVEARRHIAAIVRGVRPRHVLQAPIALTAVAMAAVALYAVPILRIGWWTAIGGTGNIVTGGTTRTGGTPLEWMIPALFLALLFPALPLFAEREEIMFRRGAEHWDGRTRIWMGLKFGLVHLIMGIPIAVALALSIGGWYFQWCYLRGHRRSGGSVRAAVLESTRAHFVYNAEVLSIAVIALILAGSLA
jgi:hypothetical protein